jgi:hypothetical protein
MTIDISRTITVEAVRPGLVRIAIGCLLLVLLLGALPFGVLVTDNSQLLQAAGWAVAAFLALFVVFAIRRSFVRRGPVVTISPDGIRDTRVAVEMIPWRAVSELATWPAGRKIIRLAVDRDVARKLTRMPRSVGKSDVKGGTTRIFIVTSNLAIRHDTLLSTMNAYWQARRGR